MKGLDFNSGVLSSTRRAGGCWRRRTQPFLSSCRRAERPSSLCGDVRADRTDPVPCPARDPFRLCRDLAWRSVPREVLAFAAGLARSATSPPLPPFPSPNSFPLFKLLSHNRHKRTNECLSLINNKWVGFLASAVVARRQLCLLSPEISVTEMSSFRELRGEEKGKEKGDNPTRHDTTPARERASER